MAASLKSLIDRVLAPSRSGASATQAAALLEQLPDVVFRADSGRRWSFLSAGWPRLTGYAVEDSLGAPVDDFLHPRDRERWQAAVDGRAAELFRANLGMSALALPAGTHRVELAYRVPGLQAGLWLAALAALALAAATLLRIRRTRRARGETCTSTPPA